MAHDDGKLGRGTVWVGIASGLSGISDVVTTVTVLWLWSSLDPYAVLGTATLAGAMLPILERIAGLGMAAAIVRHGGSDHRALSTMMWLGVAASGAVLAAMIAFGTSIGALFGEPIIGSLLIGYAARFVVQNVHVVPENLLRRDLAFDALTRVRIVASLADAVAKIAVAYAGAHGDPALRVWCFVVAPFVNAVVTSIGIQRYRPWVPQLAFDRGVAARALRYGSQVAGGELLYYLYTNADYLVIGRVWGNTAVGEYRLAYELVLDVVRLISLVTAEVAFPAFARVGRDRGRAGALLIRFSRQNAIALVPVIVFLAVAADDLLAVLYPPLPPAATTAARILCLVGGLRVISFVLPTALAGLGHARDALVYHVVAAVALPAAFAGAAWLAPDAGFVAAAWAWAVAYPLVFGVLLAQTLARCGVSLVSYARQLAGVVACGGVAAGLGIAVHATLPAPPLLRLLAVAVAVLVGFGALLARVEHVTPRSVWRALRGQPDDAS